MEQLDEREGDAADAERPVLRVGSWPGPGFRDNPLIAGLCASLGDAGALVADIEDPAVVEPGTLDVLQIHWPEQIFWQGLPRTVTMHRAWAVVCALTRLKAQGTCIVWMVHNLAPHDGLRWQRLLWRPYRDAIARLADGFLTLSPSTLQLVRDAIPGLSRKPCQFVWHPAYPVTSGAESQRAITRAALGFSPSTRVLACLGHVRPYKGVEGLLEVFRDCPGDLGLVIAGAPRDESFAHFVTAKAGNDPRIRLFLRALPDERYGALMAAADEIVAPFTDYLHSGSIVHALSAGRRVCTSGTPFAHDLASLVGGDWLRFYEPPLTPAFLTEGGLLPHARAALRGANEAALRMMRFYRSLV